MATKHILLTTDLSEEAQRAFAPVCDIAKLLGAKITLLHVVQLLTKVPQGAMLAQPVALGNPEQERKNAASALEEQSARLDSSLEITLDVITSDSVPRGVVQYAEEHDVDLIALSTHGRSGLRRMVLGSAAEGILRHAHVPVLCFPPEK